MRVGAALASFAVAATTLSIAVHARAQGIDEFGAYGTDVHRESPQEWAFELRFGRYLPNVDDGVAGTPFESTFGNGNRYLVGFEVDWQLLRIPYFGSIGPGVGWGYTKMTARAPLASGDGLSEQDTSLTLMPMYAVGVARVDVFARELQIPVVPYGKLGFGYALWWAGDGDGTARDDSGTLGRDASIGWQFALGAMLHLDPLDRASALEMDTDTGVNNSYIFVEWYYSDLDGFDGSDMQVGTSTWMAGLAFEI